VTLARRLLASQYIRFCIVGASGVVVNYTILLTLTQGLGMHYLIANAFGIAGSMTSNYFGNKLWTFR